MDARNIALTFALVLGLGPSALRADTIVQVNSRSDFNAMVGTQTTIDFESLVVPADQYLRSRGNSVTISGITFYNSISEYSGHKSSLSDDSTFLVGNGDADQVVTLPFVSWAGSDVFGGATMLVQTGTIIDSSGGVFHFTATVPGPNELHSVAFLGFIDTTPGGRITSISYDHLAVNGGDEVLIDNFSFGTTAPIPSPASAGALLMGGFWVWSNFRIRKNSVYQKLRKKEGHKPIASSP